MDTKYVGSGWTRSYGIGFEFTSGVVEVIETSAFRIASEYDPDGGADFWAAVGAARRELAKVLGPYCGTETTCRGPGCSTQLIKDVESIALHEGRRLIALAEKAASK